MKENEHVFTIGIEEEFQIVDPETRELRSHIQEILAQGKMILKEQVKPEMHQSVVELGTEICRDVADCRQLRELEYPRRAPEQQTFGLKFEALGFADLSSTASG